MLGGQFVPEGSTVSTQAYTLHRDPAVFIDPLIFWPQRWESPSQEMKDAFMPYGGGTRGKPRCSLLLSSCEWHLTFFILPVSIVCIGMHLANLELAFGAATFFREFPTARLANDTNESTMEFQNYFLIAPKSHACLVSL